MNGASRGLSRRPVVFLARDLEMGGAERAYLHYVNNQEAFQAISVLGRRDGVLLADLRSDVPLYDLSRRVPASGAGLTGEDRSATGDDPPGGFNPRSLLRLIAECRRLDRVLRVTGCGIVSSFLMRSHIIALLTKRLLRPDLRLVINVHEHMSESAEHLYPSRVDRRLMRWVTRHLFPLADRIIVVADSLREDLVRNFGIGPSLISVVRNPIDLGEIRRKAREPVSEREFPADAGPTVIAVGRLVHLKGFDLLIRAVARVSPQTGARLIIVGNGPDRSRLESLAEELGIRERVRFAGLQRNPWRFMARADVLALTSRTEAFPTVIGEALALGVPVVATDCSAGVREYLCGTEHGVLVPPDDVARLAAALEQLLVDKAMRSRYAQSGLSRVAALDLPIAVAEYESVLAQVLASDGQNTEVRTLVASTAAE